MMQIFLEFYIALLNNVLCRLYKNENYNYPPEIDNKILNEGIYPSYLAYKIDNPIYDKPIDINDNKIFNNLVF